MKKVIKVMIGLLAVVGLFFLLFKGCILVWRIFFGSLSHQWVACPHVYAGQ